MNKRKLKVGFVLLLLLCLAGPVVGAFARTDEATLRVQYANGPASNPHFLDTYPTFEKYRDAVWAAEDGKDAAVYEAEKKEFEESIGDLKPFRKSIWNMLMDIFDGTAGASDTVDEFLKFSADGSGDTWLTMVNSIYKYLSVIGVGMLIIYFLLDWNKVLLMSGGELNGKQLFACAMKLVCGYALIRTGPRLLSMLFGLNNTLLAKFPDFLAGGGSYTEANARILETKRNLLTYVSDMGRWDAFSMMAGLAIVHMGALASSGIIIFQAVSRKLEIMIRAAFMPIALGDVFNGEQSIGVRSLKKFAALVVWGFAMKVLIQLGSGLSASYIVKNLSVSADAAEVCAAGNLVRIILIPLATGGMCGALKQVCCDLFGV